MQSLVLFATREERSRASRGKGGRTTRDAASLTFLKIVVKKRAVSKWGQEIMERSQGRRDYRIPAEGVVPRIPPDLQRAPKDQASRFFQLASDHAMIAPFLKEKFGWVESDSCWWCGGGRQSKEHLFKECRTWQKVVERSRGGILRERGQQWRSV